MKNIQKKSIISSIYKCLKKMYVDFSNIGSINVDFVIYQARGTFGQVSALRGAKSLYATLV